MVSGALVGAGLLLFVLLMRFFDGAIGLAGIFGIGTYLNAKLRSYVEEVRQRAPQNLPPPPDSSFFRTPEQEAGGAQAYPRDASASTFRAERRDSVE